MKHSSREEARRMIWKGLRDGLPIGLGYFAVAFSLGITARGAGVSPLQGWVASILNHASAGEYALYALIGAHAAVWEIAAVIFVTNMRYLLMSAALSQKTSPETGFLRRLGTGFCITDEIFGLAVAHPGTVSCAYHGAERRDLRNVPGHHYSACPEEPGGGRAGGRILCLQLRGGPAVSRPVGGHPHRDPHGGAGRRRGGAFPGERGW